MIWEYGLNVGTWVGVGGLWQSAKDTVMSAVMGLAELPGVGHPGYLP